MLMLLDKRLSASLIPLLVTVVLLLGQVTLASAAKKVELKDIVVTNSSTELLLYLKVTNAFTPEIVDGVKNGIPATFFFEVVLNMSRSGWPDKEIFSGAVEHTLSYDNLKDEYLVVFSEKGGGQTTFGSLEKAQLKMAEINGFAVVALDMLIPDRQYNLSLRAVLAKKTLPFYFNYLIPFSDFWDFDTDWSTVHFRY